MFELMMFTGPQSYLTDILIWVAGFLLVAVGIALIFIQQRQGKDLAYELEQLEKVKEHNIEYEFILKAMRLSTWHIAAKTRTINSGNDFREKDDLYTPETGILIDDLLKEISEVDRQRISKSIDDICTGRTDNYHEQYQVRIPHSNKFYWEESYATVARRDEEGKPESIVGTSMIIDNRKAMETALINARNKAEESDRLKSAFIANMSHEIRTPLNAIIGFTSVLPDIEAPEERKQLIDLIQENNQKLLRIIDDVMNISKIEAGKVQLVMSSFDVNQLLTDIMTQYSQKVQPGVKLSTMFSQSQQEITTDIAQLTEILNYLMSNAVKFTMQGSIILGCDLPANGKLRIWVRDTGKGIAEEYQERIFERFFKVDEFVPGAGLGLSVCRTIAYSLGGNVGVESTLGEGSTFWIELPVK